MLKKFTLILIFSFVILGFFTSCSRPVINQQLQFGIQAAQNDLWDEAIFRWKKVIQSNPNSAAAHNNLGVAYEKKGLWGEALKEYEIALKLSPKSTYIKANYDNFKEYYQSKQEKKGENEKD